MTQVSPGHKTVIIDWRRLSVADWSGLGTNMSVCTTGKVLTWRDIAGQPKTAESQVEKLNLSCTTRSMSFQLVSHRIGTSLATDRDPFGPTAGRMPG